MNWAGISVFLGIVVMAFMTPPYSLVLLLGLVWLFRK